MIQIDEIACTGCGVCVDSCPTDVIRMKQGTQKAHVAYVEDCQACFLCEFDCPVDAITVTPQRLSEQEMKELLERMRESCKVGMGF